MPYGAHRKLLFFVAPVLERFPEFAALLKSGEDEEMREAIRKAETIGRRIGTLAWLDEIEQRTGHPVCPAKRGPKAKGKCGVK